MIDTNELRRLAQAAMHPITKGRWMRLFGERTVYDRMEDGCRGIPVVSTPVSPPHPFEAACLDFIAAADPATVSELLDRLEAAEKERDEFKRACFGHISDNSLLRAKVEQMERQEPVATIAGVDEYGPMLTWNKHWLDLAVGADLYALSGAQPAPSINEGVRKVTLDFLWESEAQHHIPTIEIEFEPVSPESPNDAKSWQDRDRLAAMLTPEAKP